MSSSSSQSLLATQISSVVDKMLQTDAIGKKEIVKYLERLCTKLLPPIHQQKITPPTSRAVSPDTYTRSYIVTGGQQREQHANNNNNNNSMVPQSVRASLTSHLHSSASSTSLYLSAAPPPMPLVSSANPLGGAMTATTSFAVLGDAVSKCTTFCALLQTYIQRDLDAFRRRLNVMTRAKSSTYLTVDEVLDTTNRAVTLEAHVAPGRLGEYVLAASVLAFCGGSSNNSCSRGATPNNCGDGGGALSPASSHSAGAGGASLWDSSSCAPLVELEGEIVSCIVSCLSIALPRFVNAGVTLSTATATSSPFGFAVHGSAAADQDHPRSSSSLSVTSLSGHRATVSAAPVIIAATDDGGAAATASASDTPVFFRFFNEDVKRVERYRLPQANAPIQIQVAAHFAVGVWEDQPYAWPVLIDPHRLTEALWIKTLPRAVIVVFDEGTLGAIIDAYCTSDVVLVVTHVPTDAVSGETLRRLGDRWVASSPSSSGHYYHHAFRLLLICTGTGLSDSLSPPSWCQSSSACFCSLHVPRLDPQTASQVALEEAHRMAWPMDAQRLDELYGALLSRRAQHHECEDALWDAAVDPTNAGEGSTAKARAQLKHATKSVAEAQHAVDALRRQRAEFKIIAEVSSRLYFTWYRATLRQNTRFGRVGGSRHPNPVFVAAAPQHHLTYPTFLDTVVFPAVWEHLTEGSKHFTKCKTEAAQEMLAWAGRLCERQLLDDNKRKQSAASGGGATSPTSTESHNAVSIALHVIRWFALGGGPHAANPGSAADGNEKYRRLVCLWDASQNNGTGSSASRGSGGNAATSSSVSLCKLIVGDVVIPRAMSEFAVSVLTTVPDIESDVFARLQRLLLTLSSIKTLLLLESYSESVKEFVEWDGHLQTTKIRFPSVEGEVVSSLVKGIQLLADPIKASELVDALSLFAALREMNASLKAVTVALLVDVPRRHASGLVRVLQEHTKECVAVEHEAQKILTEVAMVTGDAFQKPTDGSLELGGSRVVVNPNKVLEVRERVVELQEARRRLLRTDPAGQGGSGLPVMATVEHLVDLCLPSTL